MDVVIIVLGQLGVGKTSLLRKLKSEIFEEHMPPSIYFDYFSHKYEKQGQDVFVQFWDTAGQQRFGNITKQYFHKADGVAIIVSEESTASEKIQQFEKYLEMHKQHNGDKPCILIVTKIDLSKKEDKSSQQKFRADLQRLQKSYSCSFPRYLSAKNSSKNQISMVFKQLVDKVLQTKFKMDPSQVTAQISQMKLSSKIDKSEESQCCK